MCASFILVAGIALDAQWITLPTPGLPRLPDGKPHLAAPAPRTADRRPDLSGLWKNDAGDRLYNNITADLQVSWSGSIVEFSSAADGGMNMALHYVESTERGSRRK